MQHMNQYYVTLKKQSLSTIVETFCRNGKWPADDTLDLGLVDVLESEKEGEMSYR